MADILRITGLEVHGFHGVYPEERERGQLFVVDLEVDLRAGSAADTDNLEHTLDYSVLVDQVATRVAGDPVDLIETLAHEILGIVLGFPEAARARVSVHKPQAPLPFPVTDVSITVEGSR